MSGAKGDMALDKAWLCEAKSTIHGSLTIKYEWLGKISQEALVEGRSPALTVSFTDRQGRAVNFGDWVLIPLSVWGELRGDGVSAEPEAEE